MKLSSTVLAKKIKLERESLKLPIFNGGLGENPLPIPISIENALKNHAKCKYYTDASGIPELQKVLNSQHLLIGNGLKPLLMVLQLAFLQKHPTGKVVHISPYWVSYKEQTEILNIPTITLQTTSTNNWRLTKEDIIRCFDENNLKGTPHLILFNSPNNPTGYAYSEDEIKSFETIFKTYGTTVLHDHIYEHINWTHKPTTIEGAIVGSSMSKNFACGGYRFGWMIFPKELESLRQYCLCIASYMYTCPSTPIQFSAVKALEMPHDVQELIEFQNKMWQDISEEIIPLFEQHHIKCTKTEGAYYTMLDFKYYKQHLKNLNIETSEQLNKYLIESIGFVTVPAEAFGIYNEMILRYSMVDICDFADGKYNFEAIKKGIHVLGLHLKKVISKK